MERLIYLFDYYDIWLETGRTLLMTFVPVILAYVFGLPLGVLCVVTDKDGIRPNNTVNQILNVIINLGRSIPFVIMVCILIGLTKAIMGTSLGSAAACVPLTISCIPFIARITEQSLKEIDKGVIDAAKCMGATDFQIITRVYLVETIPSLVRGFAITAVTLVGYTAMSGTMGAGGLGYLAVKYGYERHITDLMWLCVVLIIALVEIIQLFIELIAKKIDKK